MDFLNTSNIDDSSSTAEKPKWNKNNSLLYLFVEYVLPPVCQNHSSTDISQCVDWLLTEEYSLGTEFQIQVGNNLEPILKHLLEAKNNVNFANRLDETVIRVFLTKYANNSIHPFKDQWLVKALLEKRASVDVVDSIGYTPLQYAATIGRVDLVRLMMNYSEDLNARNNLGHTVLHLLVYNYEQHPSEIHLRVIRDLLHKGVDVNAKNKKGLTAVHLAMENGLVNVLRVFAEHAQIDLKDYIGDDSNLLLHLCKNIAHWTHSNDEMMAFDCLIDLRRDVNSRSRKFYLTPLHFVSQVDRVDVMQMLLAAGANIEATSVDGITPLHLAMLQGSFSAVEYLMQQGANMNAKDEMVGFGLMHMAVLSGDKNKLKLLIDNGFDVNVRSKHGLTPFHVATIMADNKMLRCLIEQSVNFRGTMGILRLHSMEIDCVDTKILIGADENIAEMSLIGQYVKSLDVSTSFLEEAMILLMEAGANVNAKDSCMKTPLHYATLQTGDKLAIMLLCLGAQVDSRDDNDKLPLDNALKCRNLAGMDKLLRFGANLNDVDFGTFHEWDGDLKNKLYEYTIKLEVAEISVNETCKRHLQRHLRRTNMDDYRTECQDEVTKLKNYYVPDTNISLYEFILMSSRRRLTYVRDVLCLDLDVEFPIYEEIVEARCQESVSRSVLMKQAGVIFCQLTGYNFPEICTNQIFNFLNNRRLISVIDSYNVIVSVNVP